MVERHEALRTTFACTDGEPTQRIRAAGSWMLPQLDLDALDRETRDRELAKRVDEEGRRPFNLASGPLLRTTLVRLADDDHVLLVTMHHIVSDGWSIGVLVREVMALYPVYAEGQSPALAPLAVQYADFALWQRGWLQGEVLDRQLAYWQQRLVDVPALELPTDRPRPAVASHQGAMHAFVLPAALTGKLRQLGRQQGATLYMTLLAAFEALLYRYSGQESFAIGTPIANRTDEALEQLIGFFVNTLALRASLEGNPSFVELLARVQKEALGGYAHQAVPFERLVEQLGVERALDRAALFQVMFILQNTPVDELSLAGLRLEALPIASGTAKFDLTLAMEERGDELTGVFEYATELFDAATIERMAQQLERLLEGVVANPEQRVAELPLLSAPQRHALLTGWNDTAADFPRGACIHEQFAAQAQKTPDAIAVEFEGELAHVSRARRAQQSARASLAVARRRPRRARRHPRRAFAGAGGRSAGNPQGGRSLRAARSELSGGAAGVHDRGCADLGAARQAAARGGVARAVFDHGTDDGDDAGARGLRDLHVGLDRAAQRRRRAAPRRAQSLPLDVRALSVRRR